MSDGPVPPASSVLVSGGSRGLGLAIVTDLLASGVRVATFSRTLSPSLRELRDRHPERLVADEVDLTDDARVKRFLSDAKDHLGPLDGLVNNAAVGQDSLLVQTSAERIAELVHTNLTAPLLLTRLFLRQMLARSARARIVTISSLCAQRGYSGLTVYSATKGGLEAATRALARELHGRALVNAIAPGFFASEMSSVLGSEQMETISRRTPSGRLVEPAEILPILRMLLFEHTNLNGQVITVDGGSSI